MNIDVAHVNWFSTYHVGLQTAFTRDVRFCWAMPAHIHSPVEPVLATRLTSPGSSLPSYKVGQPLPS